MSGQQNEPSLNAIKVPHRWGFGMAPPKPQLQSRRREAAHVVLRLVAGDLVVHGQREEIAAQISEVKGLFSRSHKQDQWDWFRVWTSLGRPTRGNARLAAESLGKLARFVRSAEGSELDPGLEAFSRAGGPPAILAFLDGSPPLPEGAGFIYVLSTRHQPTLLKIGYTTRTVEERVEEINRATGVVIPFGARAVWRVRDAPQLEHRVHAELSAFRVRPDREFFEIDFSEASRTIDRVVNELGLE